jgi:hypothetical protein
MRPNSMFAILLVLVGTLQSQQIALDLSSDKKTGPGFLAKWDYSAEGVLLFRDVSVPSAAAVRIVAVDGNTVAVYPLADLPGALAVSVWDVAKTPAGGVVLSAIVKYTPEGVKPRVLKSLLLTYDKQGKIEKIWDVFPYHHHHLAVAHDGSVFALGTKSTTERDYPLLVKYSSSGRTIGEFLPASQFSVGDGVVESGSENGETQMFAMSDGLLLWLAPTQEVVKLSLDGNIRGRYSYQKVLTKLAAESNASRVRILRLSPSTSGKFTAQVQLWPLPSANQQPVLTAMIILSANGTEARLTPPGQHLQRGKFLGENRNGKAVFLEETATSGVAVHTYE